MKYDFKKIGLRIRTERKAAGFKSQDDLIDCLRNKYGYSISRNTLSAIEKGKTNHYDVELLADLCELFNCEMGYLLCEYECKTGRNTDISAATGLSEEAIEKIGDSGKILSIIIEHSSYSVVMRELNSYILSCALSPVIEPFVSAVPTRSKIYLANVERYISNLLEEIGTEYQKRYASISKSINNEDGHEAAIQLKKDLETAYFHDWVNQLIETSREQFLSNELEKINKRLDQ